MQVEDVGGGGILYNNADLVYLQCRFQMLVVAALFVLTGSEKKRRCCFMKVKANPTNSDGIDEKQQQFKAVLTWPELTLLAVGMMIGAGIFAMPGEAIIKTGPGLVRAI